MTGTVGSGLTALGTTVASSVPAGRGVVTGVEALVPEGGVSFLSVVAVVIEFSVLVGLCEGLFGVVRW